jgi:NACalpha-BTF3-like transcription factor
MVVFLLSIYQPQVFVMKIWKQEKGWKKKGDRSYLKYLEKEEEEEEAKTKDIWNIYLRAHSQLLEENY